MLLPDLGVFLQIIELTNMYKLETFHFVVKVEWFDIINFDDIQIYCKLCICSDRLLLGKVV